MFSGEFLHVMHANEDMAWHDNGVLPHAGEKIPLEGAADTLTSDLLSNLTLTSVRRQTIRSLSHSTNGNETGAVMYAVMTPLWVKLLCWRR